MSNKLRFVSNKLRFVSNKLRFGSNKLRLGSNKLRFMSNKLWSVSNKLRFVSNKLRFVSNKLSVHLCNDESAAQAQRVIVKSTHGHLFLPDDIIMEIPVQDRTISMNPDKVKVGSQA